MILWKCVYPTSNLFSEFRFLLIGFSNIMCIFITFGFASWFYTLMKASSGTNSSCLSSEDAWVYAHLRGVEVKSSGSLDLGRKLRGSVTSLLLNSVTLGRRSNPSNALNQEDLNSFWGSVDSNIYFYRTARLSQVSTLREFGTNVNDNWVLIMCQIPYWTRWAFSYFILVSCLWGKDNYFPHFSGEETGS